MFGIGSDDEPLLQQRREVIPVEVNPASDSDRRAKRRRLHGTFGQERQDLLDDRRVAALQLQGESPRRVQPGIRLRRRRIRLAARRRLPFRLPLRPLGLARGEDLDHRLAHRLLVAVADHVPVVGIPVHERIAASSLLVALHRRSEAAPRVVLRTLDDPGLPGVDVDVRRSPPHDLGLRLVVALVVAPFEHRAVVVMATVEGHREVLLERAHERRRIPHPPHEGIAVFAEARHVSLRRSRALQQVGFLVLETFPRAENLRKRSLAIEGVDATEDLPVVDLLRFGHVDEDVEVIRHDRIREHHDAAELLHATQEPDRPRLLLVIQKERPMCQTADQMVAPAVLD